MGHTPSDDELILLYRQTVRPLYAFVSKRVGGDRALAEDLVQEAWLRAVRHWSRAGAPDQPLAWLQQVARNVLVSHFRRRRPRPMDPADIDLRDDRFRPDSPDAAALVSWGLARLRGGQAAVLEAQYFEGKSVREIAGELGTSERAVEGRLRRARSKLRRLLKPLVGPTTGGIDHAKQTRAR